MANLWIISRTLPSDTDALDALHMKYLYGHSNFGQSEQDKTEFVRYAEEELNGRYKAYYQAWNEESVGDQTLLVITMLEHILNEGKPDERLTNAILMYAVNTRVLGMMKAVLDFRSGFEVTKR